MGLDTRKVADELITKGDTSEGYILLLLQEIRDLQLEILLQVKILTKYVTRPS